MYVCVCMCAPCEETYTDAVKPKYTLMRKNSAYM